MTAPFTPPRPATRADVPAMAAIVVAWEGAQDWLPDPPRPETIAGYIDAAFDAREIRVLGDPARAYASVDPQAEKLVALYCARPGQGDGKRLLDAAREGRDFLWLTTHAPNTAAHRFYAREGFVMAGELPPEPPHEDVPLYRMEWRR